MQQAAVAQKSRERLSHAEPHAGQREHLHRPEGRCLSNDDPGRDRVASGEPNRRAEGVPSPMETPEPTETPGPTSQPEPDDGEARQLSRPKGKSAGSATPQTWPTVPPHLETRSATIPPRAGRGASASHAKKARPEPRNQKEERVAYYKTTWRLRAPQPDGDGHAWRRGGVSATRKRHVEKSPEKRAADVAATETPCTPRGVQPKSVRHAARRGAFRDNSNEHVAAT